LTSALRLFEGDCGRLNVPLKTDFAPPFMSYDDAAALSSLPNELLYEISCNLSAPDLLALESASRRILLSNKC
jgi:hypothetical protein